MESTELALFSAILNDPEHKERLASLRAEMKGIEDSREELRIAAEKANETLATARGEREAAEAALAATRDAEAKLSADTQALAQTIASLNEEKARFEAVRQKVDADHKTREAALVERERQAKVTDDRHVKLQKDLATRSQRIEAHEALHARRAAAIKSALEVS